MGRRAEPSRRQDRTLTAIVPVANVARPAPESPDEHPDRSRRLLVRQSDDGTPGYVDTMINAARATGQDRTQAEQNAASSSSSSPGEPPRAPSIRPVRPARSDPPCASTAPTGSLSVCSTTGSGSAPTTHSSPDSSDTDGSAPATAPLCSYGRRSAQDRFIVAQRAHSRISDGRRIRTDPQSTGAGDEYRTP